MKGMACAATNGLWEFPTNYGNALATLAKHRTKNLPFIGVEIEKGF